MASSLEEIIEAKSRIGQPLGVAQLEINGFHLLRAGGLPHYIHTEVLENLNLKFGEFEILEIYFQKKFNVHRMRKF